MIYIHLYSSSFYGFSGKYSPEDSGKLIFRAAPAFSLSGRTKENSTSQTPGNVFHQYQLKIWVTKNRNFTCNSYFRSSSLYTTSCPGAQNSGHICSPHLLTLWPWQDWKLSWGPEEGTFFYAVIKTISVMKKILSFTFTLLCLSTPLRLLALLPTRSWTLVFTGKGLPSTAW